MVCQVNPQDSFVAVFSVGHVLQALGCRRVDGARADGGEMATGSHARVDAVQRSRHRHDGLRTCVA